MFENLTGLLKNINLRLQNKVFKFKTEERKDVSKMKNLMLTF